MAKFVSKAIQMRGSRMHMLSLYRGQTSEKRTLPTSFMCWKSSRCNKPQPPVHKPCVSGSNVISSVQSLHTSSTLFVSDPVKTVGEAQSSENLIEAWYNEVNTFGTVCVHNAPFDIHIQPLNPMEYPDHNKSIVKMYYNTLGSNGDTGPLSGRKLSELGKLCDMKVHAGAERVDVRCDVPSGVQLPLICVVTVPLKFDVEVRGSSGGNVTVSSLESNTVSVRLQHGNCHLINLKTASVNVQCDDGNISCSKQLLGTIHLQCGKHGSITGNRLQGTSIKCVTESGDIDIKTIYAEKSSCTSQSGQLHIRDCHGDVTATVESGDLSIDSLDGKLSAELGSGSADVFVTRQDGVSIQSKQGDVTLRFSDESSCSLDLDAPVIEQDESLNTSLDSQGKGFLKSETEAVVKASAPQGKVSLKKQDWLSSIKLQFGDIKS